jgi:hypothetical protein
VIQPGKLVHAHANPIVKDGDSLMAIAISPSISPSLEVVLRARFLVIWTTKVVTINIRARMNVARFVVMVLTVNSHE